jgi:murein endopeptidase
VVRPRHRLLPAAAAVIVAALVLALVLLLRDGDAPRQRPSTTAPARTAPFDVPQRNLGEIAWRRSRAVGRTNAGRLVGGVQLPAEGPDWFTWDPILKQTPNRSWRRWGTDHLLRTVLRVLRAYREANPHAPRVGIGDISRPYGGEFGRRFGGIGHASHQNGLDVDLYYPRRDGLERRAYRPALVDRALAQDLVDRFAAAGAQYLFVGPRLRLRGRRGVVSELAHHDDHLHVRVRRAS